MPKEHRPPLKRISDLGYHPGKYGANPISFQLKERHLSQENKN
jgi:hypothetical protein